MHFQWYPGHMTKAKRMMAENIKLIDLVIELTDARIPMSSRNPDIDELGKHKARLILLNKADLADEACTNRWATYFENQGCYVLKVNAKDARSIKPLLAKIAQACKEKRDRDQKRGILHRPVRAMVVGIPNVGKSTLINSLAGKACAKTGNKPGVTKGKQWIRLNTSVELLDTPGILWPKFEDPEVGLKLAFIGAIKEELLQTEELALTLIQVLQKRYPEALQKKYGVRGDGDAVSVLTEIAKNRNCIVRGEQADLRKAAMLLNDDFRNGRVGRITLELPEEVCEGA